jgi:hypothetical protein
MIPTNTADRPNTTPPPTSVELETSGADDEVCFFRLEGLALVLAFRREEWDENGVIIERVEEETTNPICLRLSRTISKVYNLVV